MILRNIIKLTLEYFNKKMFILKFFSYIFLFFVKLRLICYKYGIFKSYKINNVTIISIGNISFGGTGKTPTTIEVAKNLLRKKFKISILLRGYKRKSKASILLVSNGKETFCNPIECGDEAYLLASKLKCPVVVAKDRVKGATYIVEKFNPDYIILDDGFQHLRLKRDIDIVLLTQKSLKHKIYTFPAGKFREPLSHIKRASFIIITKIFQKETLKRDYAKLKAMTNKDIFACEIFLEHFIDIEKKILDKDFFSEKEVIIFCGIGQPEYFEKLLIENNIVIKEKLFFPDHYTLKDSDYNKINSLKNYPILTTEKDFVKLNSKLIESDIYAAIISYKFFKII